MTPAETNHLSEEALDDVLIGLGSPESEIHLARCPECRAKVGALRSDIGLFNAASIAWSQGQRSGMPPTASQGTRIHVAFLAWAALALLVAVAVAGVWRSISFAPSRNNVVQSQPADSEAQIAQDNQLLQAVDAAISPDELSPVIEYDLAQSPHPHGKAHLRMTRK